MVLVAYSDSEGSEDEKPSQPSKAVPKPGSSSKFAVDKTNPSKIRVNLPSLHPPATERTDGEPAAKRPRIGGGGAFGDFNAMLPAPKRDNLSVKASERAKAPARKVFSLKTGAEPAFSRDSDAELRQLFAEQDDEARMNSMDADIAIPSTIPKPKPPADAEQPVAAKPFLFKPLSVARNTKKKKVALNGSKTIPVQEASSGAAVPAEAQPTVPPLKKKINLFSSGTETEPAPAVEHEEEDEDEIVEVLSDEDVADQHTFDPPSMTTDSVSQPQSLDSIAMDLNLSAADRRQLFGRHGATSTKASHILNFNTDTEYAANQEFLASTDAQAQQHNPVRAIAPGKHSLKQLVASAQGQKDALEESFATGRRNKKEAGTKYGW